MAVDVFDARKPRKSPTGAGKAIGGAGRAVDDRVGGAGFVRESMNKVFPDHWSFMIGEIALYSFIILLLTGTYLALFFHASTTQVIYNGSYLPLRGVPVSDAYASSLNISFDVRAGLLIRQIHHWAALLFVMAMVVHACRVFFTGAYRKPRELNWILGVGLLVLGIVEGFAGYSLPDDLLSGTGLRIAFSIAESVPLVGTWAAFLLFGGAYPGTEIIGRLYVVHILIVPGVILGLIAAHMGLLWHQKHTQFPGPGKTENNVVGERMFPAYAAKAGGFFFLVFAVLALLGGVAQINPIWLFGPYNPSVVSAGSQPDWYMGFIDGATRIMPNWEWRGWGHDIPFMILFPCVILPGIMFTAFALWPWIEQRMTGDKAFHNLLERPRDNPTRTAIGVMSLTFYLVLLAAGGVDVLAALFHISMNALIWASRIGLFVLPPVMFKATKLICTALQDHEHEAMHHGYETGIVRRLPSGEYIEVHAPLPAPHQPHLTPVETTTFAELVALDDTSGVLVTAGAGHVAGSAAQDGRGSAGGAADLVPTAGRPQGPAGFFGIRRRH